jgi:PKD repeat protein
VLLASGAPGFAHHLIYNFPFTFDPGWTTEGGWEYAPALQYGPPPGELCAPTEAPTDTNIYCYQVDGCGYPDEMDAEYLTTPALDCSGLTGTTLRFWRDLGVAGPDRAAVEISTDGVDWTTVWENSEGQCDFGVWQPCEYDISAIADGQPTVYLRWVMGPSELDACYASGWRIDDVEIWGDTANPPLQILAWLPFADPEWEYPNTLAALASQFTHFVVTESFAIDPAVLSGELVGKRVFLLTEPDNGNTTQLERVGADFAPVLQEFVEQGGTVIVCGEYADWQGFLTASGLMTTSYVTQYSSGEPLPVGAPGHPIAAGLGGTVAAQETTCAYSVDGGVTSIVEDGAGNTVVGCRDIGAGAAILLGYDYGYWDADAALILANSVQYPSQAPRILVFDDWSYQQSAQEALARLGLSATVANATNFNTLLGSQAWDTVVVDCPGNTPIEGWDPLIGYVANGGEVALSTYDLTDESALAAAFQVQGVEALSGIPPIYRWVPDHPLFNYPQTVPDLISWGDYWGYDADRLQVISPTAAAVAGYTGPPADGEAALVVGNGGRTIINGFLWDDHNQDSDADGTQDCVELVMNEVWFLLHNVEAQFRAYPRAGAPPLDVEFVDDTANEPTSWSWDFGDGNTSTDQNPTHEYGSVGLYTVSLTAGNDLSEDTETKVNYIEVAETPVVDFTGSPTSGPLPLTVNFTDLSTNSPTYWAWDFGDGALSDQQNPSHEYTAVGLYTVSLTAGNIGGEDTKTRSDYIAAGSVPVPDFSAAPLSGAVPLTVAFSDLSTNSPSYWAWDFGTGVYSGQQNPTYEYDAPGVYTVSLTAGNALGEDTATKLDYITAAVAPVADFVADPTEGGVPLTVDFADLSTNDPTSWSWDFGDGGASTEANPSHQYTNMGRFTVALTVANAAGEDTETKTDYIYVTDLPAADFSGSPTSGPLPLTVNFTDLSTNSPTAWEWDFGDDGTATTQNPSHEYALPGIYTVSLMASNVAGDDTETKVGYITAGSVPVADFSAAPLAGAVPLTVAFTDLSTNHPTYWAWDFGDGIYSDQQNPTYEYDAPGIYAVSLTAGNALGEDTETKLDYITAAVAPVADFVADPTEGAVPLMVSFADLSTNDPTSWSWDFGDGGASTEANPDHQYMTMGTFTVSLTVANAAGEDTKTKTGYIYVTTDPVADFSATPTAGPKPLLVQFTDLTTNEPNAWYWDFGDGTFATTQNPSHEYGEPGFYSIEFSVNNLVGSDAALKENYIAVGFQDTPADFWAFYQIIACHDAGVVQGYWDGYHPAETVTRAQMAVYMARAIAGGDAYVPDGPPTPTFSDVPPSHWAYKYVEYAVANDIVIGYWDGYHPNETVTRAQMAVYVSRAMAGGDPFIPDGPPTPTFPDVPTSYWAYKWIEYAYAQGVVQGYWDGYRPEEVVNRGQMAVFVQRAFDLWIP